MEIPSQSLIWFYMTAGYQLTIFWRVISKCFGLISIWWFFCWLVFLDKKIILNVGLFLKSVAASLLTNKTKTTQFFVVRAVEKIISDCLVNKIILLLSFRAIKKKKKTSIIEVTYERDHISLPCDLTGFLKTTDHPTTYPRPPTNQPTDHWPLTNWPPTNQPPTNKKSEDQKFHNKL